MLVVNIISAAIRLGLASRPSLLLYFMLRVVVSITGPAFYLASTAAIVHLDCHGTPANTEASSLVSRYALLASIIGTRVGQRIETPTYPFMLCGGLQLVAVAALSTFMPETLPVCSPMEWSVRRASPFLFVDFFRHSRPLTALAVLTMLRALPSYLNIDAVYRRQRFGVAYGREQES